LSGRGPNLEKVATLLQKLNSDPQFVLAQHAGTTHDLLDICLKRATVQGVQHVFQQAVHPEGKPTTNQKSSGRCWIFPWRLIKTDMIPSYCSELRGNTALLESWLSRGLEKVGERTTKTLS
uniref:Uncharacterized protein n=1 Tax=Balaenoptera musculus TaxID=9771 RepID=A0A8C0CB30_BALMU